MQAIRQECRSRKLAQKSVGFLHGDGIPQNPVYQHVVSKRVFAKAE